jgi:hypothetical protein
MSDFLTKTFWDVINTYDGNGYFHTQSASLQRNVIRNDVHYYEDGINGMNLRSFCDSGYDSLHYVKHTNFGGELPFQYLHPHAMAPNCLVRVDGTPVRKTHINDRVLLIKLPNGLVYSADHTNIKLPDYHRKGDSVEEIKNPSLRLAEFGMIYLHDTDTLLYDPKPIKITEPDEVVKEGRYAFISELMPIAQMWLSLHGDDQTVKDLIHRYNPTDVALPALIHLADVTDISEIALIPSWTNHAPEDLELTTVQVIRALVGCAKYIEDGNKSFNNWINGLVTNEYPFLIYHPPETDDEKNET